MSKKNKQNSLKKTMAERAYDVLDAGETNDVLMAYRMAGSSVLKDFFEGQHPHPGDFLAYLGAKERSSPKKRHASYILDDGGVFFDVRPMRGDIIAYRSSDGAVHYAMVCDWIDKHGARLYMFDGDECTIQWDSSRVAHIVIFE